MQGLTPAAREQVLMLSLSALETITSRDIRSNTSIGHARITSKTTSAALQSRQVVAEASCMACRAMLGVVLPELAQQARVCMAVGEQQEGVDNEAWLEEWQGGWQGDAGASAGASAGDQEGGEIQKDIPHVWVGTLWQAAEGKMGLYDGALARVLMQPESKQQGGERIDPIPEETRLVAGSAIREQALAAVQQPPVTLR